MRLDDYQQQAMKSIAISERGVAALAHRSLGLAGEAGEVANIVKKIIRDHGGALTAKDIIKLKEKLGDTLYYLAVFSEYLDLKLSDIANDNLKKSAAFLETHRKRS